MDSSEYRVWKQASSAKLWVHGEHGDGKIVLTYYILRSLSLDLRLGDEQDVVSIFCSSKDSEVGVVASLVY